MKNKIPQDPLEKHSNEKTEQMLTCCLLIYWYNYHCTLKYSGVFRGWMHYARFFKVAGS